MEIREWFANLEIGKSGSRQFAILSVSVSPDCFLKIPYKFVHGNPHTEHKNSYKLFIYHSS